MSLTKWRVAPADLTAGLQDVIPYLTVTATDLTNGTASVAIQAMDAAGNTLAQRFRVRTWVGDADFGTPVAADTYVANGTTVELEEYLAEADYDVISPATGLTTLLLTDNDGAHYIMAEVDGRIFSDDVTITTA